MSRPMAASASKVRSAGMGGLRAGVRDVDNPDSA